MSDDVQISSITGPLDEVGGRALVEAWRLSGLSGAAFCRHRQMRPQRLHYWRERLGYPMRVVGESLVGAGAAWASPSPSSSDGFVQMVVRPSPSVEMPYVDVVVGAATVRVRPGFDGWLLRSVVQALSGGTGS
jgi:hypothetical protein